MAKKFKFCLHCRRSITESQVGRGEFVKTPYGFLCPECAGALQEPEMESVPTPPAATGAAVEPPAPQPVPAPEPPAPPPPPPEPQAAPEPPPPPPEPQTAAAPPPLPEPTPTPETPAAPQAPDDPVYTLAGIRQEVEAIRRVLLFEKASPWNVLAIVAQCAAAAVFGLAILQWLDNPQNLFLCAIVLQLMALTFFVKGK